MQNFINNLVDSDSGITFSGLWSGSLPLIPFIIIIFSVAFGLGIICTILKEGSRGKIK